MIVGDLNQDRLKQAASFGCETVDVSKGDPKDQIEQILGVPEVDAGVDAVGFEARGHGEGSSAEAPATVLNSMMDITRAGGKLGIPGLYVTGDPGASDDAAKEGSLSIRIGLGWAKSHVFVTGQCPVMKYHRELMQAILSDRAQIAKAVNAKVISLDEAPQGYKDFDKGESVKFVLNPNGLISRQEAGREGLPADRGVAVRHLEHDHLHPSDPPHCADPIPGGADHVGRQPEPVEPEPALHPRGGRRRRGPLPVGDQRLLPEGPRRDGLGPGRLDHLR